MLVALMEDLDTFYQSINIWWMLQAFSNKWLNYKQELHSNVRNADQLSMPTIFISMSQIHYISLEAEISNCLELRHLL